MTITQLELHILQLTHYFVINKGYQTIQIKGMEDEIWLFHPKKQKYQFIRIVSSMYRDEEIASIQQVQDALTKILNRKGTLLNIHFDLFAYDKEEINGIKTIGIESQFYTEKVIDQYFPQTATLFGPAIDITGDYLRYKGEIETALKNRQKYLNVLRLLHTTPWISVGVAIFCVLIWIGIQILSVQFAPNAQYPASIVLGAYYRMFIVSNQEYWRFLTAGFVHIDIVHLVMNVMSLINVGMAVEKFYGKWKYSLILLGSMITATTFAHFNSSTIIVLGLSGGVYGAFAALLVILVYTKAIRNPSIMRSVGTVVVINILINFLPSVSMVGHLGGFIGGLILSILFVPGKEKKLLRINTAIAAAVFVVFVNFRLASTNPIFDFYGGTDLKVIEIYDKLGFHNYAKGLYRGINQVYGGAAK